MSRSGYTDDIEDTWRYIMWRGRVASSIRGKRGQALMLDLLAALDAMPDKRLYPNSFATATGEYCTLGVLGVARGTKMDDLGDADAGCDERLVAERFGVAAPLVQEIMDMNDQWISDSYPDHGKHHRSTIAHDDNAPYRRWCIMRSWVAEQIRVNEAAHGIKENT